MKNILILLLFAATVLLGASTFRGEAPDQTDSDLIINLTSDATVDPHSSLMGLHLAQNALNHGMEVTVFLNVHGVKLMKDGSESITFHGENLHDLMQTFLEAGGTILACPHCMQVEGVDEDDLMPGVTVADQDAMMAGIKAGPTVFTY